jgi:acyl-CoA thioesterase-1
MRLLIALLFIFAWPLHAASPKHLIIIGDSITEGFGVSHDQAFPALLQEKIDKLNKNWLVVGSGISGSTTASAPSRVQWHVKQKPALIILALGANDGLRGTKTKVIEENLTKALDICRKAGVKVVLAGMKMPPNYGSEYTKEFEAVFLKVASKTGVPFIPFLLDKVAGDPKLNQEDGIHPNEKGHAVIAETVFKAIHKFL